MGSMSAVLQPIMMTTLYHTVMVTTLYQQLAVSFFFLLGMRLPLEKKKQATQSGAIWSLSVVPYRLAVLF